MLYRLLYGIVFLSFHCNILFAQGVAENSDTEITEVKEIVYFSEFKKQVWEKIPEIQMNLLDNLQAQINMVKSGKNKEWNFDIRTGLFQEVDFTGNLDSPFIFQKGWELQTSLSKTFASIGGRMNLEFLYRQFRAEGIVNGNSAVGMFYVPTLTLQYVQPLLKNAFGLLDRVPGTLAGFEKKITEWSVENENAHLLSNYKKLYMQWIVYDQVRTFLNESLQNALKLEDLSIKQLRSRYIDEVDFHNVKMLVLNIENELMEVNISYTNLMNQVSYIMDRTNIQPDSGEWIVMNQVLQNESFEGITFEKTRQALILEFMGQKLKYSAGSLKNLQMPELNLILSASMEVYATNSVPVREDIIIVPAFYAGVNFRYPFCNIDYQVKSLEYKKGMKEYEFLMQKAQSDFDRYSNEKKKNLLFYREKINNRNAVQDALQKRYTAQYRKFIQGREQMASLVETQNSILKNRIEEADVQLRLVYEYFDYLVLHNQDEISVDY
ncbi:MAG: hypothetical protein ACRCTQ_04280 [Brevinemataceae bacterium]